MKKIIIFILVLLGILILGTVYTNLARAEEDYLITAPVTEAYIRKVLKEIEKEDPKACPYPMEMWEKSTLSDCLNCHIKGSFKIKEFDDQELYNYPHENMKRKIIDGGEVIYYYLKDVPERQIEQTFEYMEKYNIKHLIIELNTPGGPLFNAIRTKNIINVWKNKGYRVDTRLYGYAMSAGLILFMTGETRLASPDSIIMWHEIQSYKMSFGISIEVSTPSDKEEEAKILRFFNDIGQNYLASLCGLTKDQLDEMTKKKEMWIDGRQALEYGFATGLIE